MFHIIFVSLQCQVTQQPFISALKACFNKGKPGYFDEQDGQLQRDRNVQLTKRWDGSIRLLKKADNTIRTSDGRIRMLKKADYTIRTFDGRIRLLKKADNTIQNADGRIQLLRKSDTKIQTANGRIPVLKTKM